MEPKGNVLIKREFVATKNWPAKQFTLKGVIDLEAEYKKCLAGNLCLVMDMDPDPINGCYLVRCDSPVVGPFLWNIEIADTVKGSFLPIYKENGILIPAGLTGINRFIWMAQNMDLPSYENYRK